MKNWKLAGVAAFALALIMSSAERSNLTGKVVDASGQPIKDATVFVYTAGPKVGTGSICPSCYADCRKKAQTDAEGGFKIESLDPKLIFKLLAVGSGLQPKFVSKVDPASGPQTITMDPIQEDSTRARVKGIVLGPEGQPIFGAVLNVEGIESGRGTRWGGVDRDVDPVAVSDEEGLFLLRCSEGSRAVHARLETIGYAKRWVRLTPGNDHIIRVDDGVTVRGQVLSNGAPVPNAVVALVTVEREAGKSLHDFEGITDENGKFAILNVTPDLEYFLFGKMQSFGQAGALPLKRIKAGATETTVDLGVITLTRAHTLKGRVILTDGQPIPPNTRALLGRDEAWDYAEALIDSEGRFEFTGVPAESVTLSVRIKGYKASKRNPSLDWLNGGLIGRLERDIDDLIILLEPGAWRYDPNQMDMPPGVERQPRELPLRGAAL